VLTENSDTPLVVTGAMQGHANPGFLASLSAGSLRQLQWSREASSTPLPPSLAHIADPDTDIDSDSFLSDLEVGSARGVDTKDRRGLDDLMATVSGGSTLEEKQKAVTKELAAVFQDIPLDTPNSLEDRSSNVPVRPPSSFGQRNLEKSVSLASRSSGSQINREQLSSSQRSGSSRGSGRRLPPARPEKPSPIPEEEESVVARNTDGSIELRFSQGGLNQRERPEPRLANLFGLIDTRKVEVLLNTRIMQRQECSVPLPNDRLSARDARVLSQSYGDENEEGEMGLLCCLARTSERDLVPWPPSIEAACWSGLVATLLLVVAMAAPYWLVSWQDTQSPFLRMGPWEACFYRFRFPRFQFDHLFTGCDPVWGHEYRLIREWLLPPWLLTVQALLLLSLLLSIFARILSVLAILRLPVTVFLRYGERLLLTWVVADLLAFFLLLLASTTFAICCWSRQWLLYPNYNYLSWAWVACLLSSWLHAVAAFTAHTQVQQEKARRPQNLSLLNELEPPAPLSLSLAPYI